MATVRDTKPTHAMYLGGDFMKWSIGLLLLLCLFLAYRCFKTVHEKQQSKEYKELESDVLNELGFSDWNMIPYVDKRVIVKSRQALEKYDAIKYFKDNKEMIDKAEQIINKKNDVSKILRDFKNNNKFVSRDQYKKIERHIDGALQNAGAYRISINYISSAGNNLGERVIKVTQYDLSRFKKDPSLLMGKGEYSKYLKEQQKEALERKHHAYYSSVNEIIDYANENREALVIEGSREQLDTLINQLFDHTVNSIKKVKTIDSEEWLVIGDFINHIRGEITELVNRNEKILAYYDSIDFAKIKDTCEALMSSQREFNEYISQKVESISKLFGTRVVRNETTTTDEYNYIRPYKKTITPFTAEVSATVFASAENSPLDYVVKYFYPNKSTYPEQIQKLHTLIEELETLREAKQIIDNYKIEYQQYLASVPDYIMREDEAGFYSRLGLVNIDENVLNIEYKFTYTSGGGMAQRSFTVPMTEENIIEIAQLLERKLTTSAFSKEQRSLMTKKLRNYILNRDNFTCCNCGNSSHVEPNLLLEIDHIIPVAKGGCTVEDNLQTLCWKCNRSKSDKLIGG